MLAMLTFTKESSIGVFSQKCSTVWFKQLKKRTMGPFLGLCNVYVTDPGQVLLTDWQMPLRLVKNRNKKIS